jgi:hypothetical protein
MKRRLYPIGQQDFNEIIQEGKVYVDKTKFAHSLISTNKYYFLSRPRRFGKSLLISTLESIFLGKKELFKNLFIEDKWSFEEYPIIRISFANIGYREMQLDQALDKKLTEIAQSYNLEVSSFSISQKFKDLITKLHLLFNKKVVVLIDEYDKPIIDYLDKENLHKSLDNRDTLKTFYSILKDADPHLQLVFITGVSKFSKISIFSDLNNLNDISMDLDYNEICGISQQELEENFVEELRSVDKEKMKKWYNGYRWHRNGNTLYNPFSILNFFGKNGDYANFWYATGTPTFLMKLCKENKLYDISHVKLKAFTLSNFDIENLQAMPILFQTGYLTLSKYDDVLDIYTLDYPNDEVRSSYLFGLLEVYMFANSGISTELLSNLKTSLETKDSGLLKATINQAFALIPYDLWKKDDEHFYHAIVHLLFSLLGVYIQSEVHTKNGRADAIVLLHEEVFCMEFKLNQTAQKALQQIKDKGYTDYYKRTNHTIHHIGINFNSQEKKVEEILWEID